MNDDANEFKTFDLALASALVVQGFSISSLEHTQYGGRVAFMFKRGGDLDEAIQAYWADSAMVNPRVYFDALKHLKTRIYAGS